MQWAKFQVQVFFKEFFTLLRPSPGFLTLQNGDFLSNNDDDDDNDNNVVKETPDKDKHIKTTGKKS